ncbi:hypothetical protein LR48_Vigan04g202700 [Vigna angularis]|uniref:Uncharacterized protein n=1 Tax=Phaseolus angularis TaxID=3914 RepID=A0A0L9UGY5_PHAAN|nr:hypothetical protein LR48_Vigan04g202700 [Vigna angularis]
MLSAKAFAQRIDALCEWFERVALCLMIHMASQGAMRLIGEFIRIASLIVVRMVTRGASLSEDSHSELGRYARNLWIRSTNVCAMRVVHV